MSNKPPNWCCAWPTTCRRRASCRASEGFTRWLPSVLVVLTYAVWSGVGTALTAIIGWTFFRDAFHPTALGGIALIILGVVVLTLGGARHE